MRLGSLILAVSLGPVCTTALFHISHLSFTNHTVIIANKSRSSFQRFMVVLHYYKVVLGQLISQVKSNFYIRGLKVIAIKYLINTSYFSLENKLI